MIAGYVKFDVNSIELMWIEQAVRTRFEREGMPNPLNTTNILLRNWGLKNLFVISNDVTIGCVVQDECVLYVLRCLDELLYAERNSDTNEFSDWKRTHLQELIDRMSTARTQV